MRVKRYKAVIYDIDGTLMDTFDRNMYPLLRIIEEELGEVWTIDQVRRFHAQPGLKTIAELGVENVKEVYARWVSYVNAYGRDAEPRRRLSLSSGCRAWLPSRAEVRDAPCLNGLPLSSRLALRHRDRVRKSGHEEAVRRLSL